MFHFSLWKLLGYAALGRGVKFYIVGVIFHYFGRSSEDFVMSYLSLIMSGLAVLILIVYFFYRRNKRKKEKERSEEHTSELQSRGHLVCRLLLEKKKTHI